MAIVEYKKTKAMTQGCVKAAPFIVKSLALILQYVFSTDYIYQMCYILVPGSASSPLRLTEALSDAQPQPQT